MSYLRISYCLSCHVAVLCVDNARIHCHHRLQAIAAPYGVRVVMIPPYSPDLNPIEKCFGLFKTALRREVGGYLEFPYEAIFRAFLGLEPWKIKACYHFCWSVLP